MFFTILIIGIILVAVVLILPYISGLTKIEIDPHAHAKHIQQQKKKSTSSTTSQQPQVDQFGYLPPDEVANQQSSSEDHSIKARASAIKDKFQVTAEDMPIRIKLNRNGSSGVSSSLRRRHEKLDVDTDPNKYDYDIDELIIEENELAKKEQEHDFYKNQEIGKEKEEMV